ncbi:hypothetical protein NE236_29565 [Actinoallomurus purpureus]|nr:hypothetical protein [Actinoallomurus purpureus]MCO6009127.1 hypothetical protein [Actinoallomurus purpureus]
MAERDEVAGGHGRVGDRQKSGSAISGQEAGEYPFQTLGVGQAGRRVAGMKQGR